MHPKYVGRRFRFLQSHDRIFFLENYYHFKISFFGMQFCRLQSAGYWCTTQSRSTRARLREHASLGRQKKSSITRRRGLLRIAISTAPHLSGSGRSTCPPAWLFIHPPGNKKSGNTMVRMSCLEIARLKCGEIIASSRQRYGSRTSIQQAQPYSEQERYILAIRVATCLILLGGWHPIDASRRRASTAEHGLWSAL